VADVLFGEVSPSGRLPVTVPYRTADLPAFADYAMRGRTYRFGETEPLYPFGFGLSYTTLTYGPLRLSAGEIPTGAAVTARTTVTNRGQRAVDEVVQCYVCPPRGWPEAPRATLVGFQKVRLPAQGEVEVEFVLTSAALALRDAAGIAVAVAGDFKIVIGAASPGDRAVALGAPVPAQGTLRVGPA
jgi:beta-glucosidase